MPLLESEIKIEGAGVGKIGNFNGFCSTDTYGVFNGVVVGLKPKGIPGRMSDGVR